MTYKCVRMTVRIVEMIESSLERRNPEDTREDCIRGSHFDQGKGTKGRLH